jgi:hypothetical protein
MPRGLVACYARGPKRPRRPAGGGLAHGQSGPASTAPQHANGAHQSGQQARVPATPWPAVAHWSTVLQEVFTKSTPNGGGVWPARWRGPKLTRAVRQCEGGWSAWRRGCSRSATGLRWSTTAAVGSYGLRKVRRRLAYHWLKNKAHGKASHWKGRKWW